MSSTALNFLDPGPEQRDVLTLQDGHRSTSIWNGDETGVLEIRKSDTPVMRGNDVFPLSVQERLRNTGFYGIYRLGTLQVDWALITSLVERWRQETHSFHLPFGEASITVQDVAVLTGLPIVGKSVVTRSTCEFNYIELCERLLGRAPPPEVVKGSRLKMKWISENFGFLPPFSNEETEMFYVRAWILSSLGGYILSDKSTGWVKLTFLPLLEDLNVTGKYSWGSAALAILYREMCRATKHDAKQIAGPLFILQLWAFSRLSHISPKRLKDFDLANSGADDELDRAPLGLRWHCKYSEEWTPTHVLTYYRDQLDRMKEEQMTWEPYSDDDLSLLPAYCLEGRNIWLARVPLICFSVVEWHLPERVMRQFGMFQQIPDLLDTSIALHGIDERGRQNTDWTALYAEYIAYWDNRESYIVPHVPSTTNRRCTDEYLPWFRRITRRLIGKPVVQLPQFGALPSAGIIEILVDGLKKIHIMAREGVEQAGSSEEASRMQEMVRVSYNSLNSTRLDSCLQLPQTFHTHGLVNNIPRPAPKKTRGKGKATASTHPSVPTAPDAPLGHTSTDGPSQSTFTDVPSLPTSTAEQSFAMTSPSMSMFSPTQSNYIPGASTPPTSFGYAHATPSEQQVPDCLVDMLINESPVMLSSTTFTPTAAYLPFTNYNQPPLIESQVREEGVNEEAAGGGADNMVTNNQQADGGRLQRRRNPPRNRKKPPCGTH